MSARKGALPATLQTVGFIALLLLFVALPLVSLFARATQPEAWSDWLTAPGLSRTLANTALLGALAVVVTVPLAFILAYGLSHTRLPAKGAFAFIGSAPLLAPSLLPALGLVYLLGRQGLLAPIFGAGKIYGLPGVLAAEVFAALPHAVLILRPALAAQDGRIYEQASLLGASRIRIFLRLTCASAAHGVAAAALVVFALAISDVGAPKVVGGGFDVVALDIYRRVVGEQNFEGGAISALFLLGPSLLAAVGERWLAARRTGAGGGQSTGFRPEPNLARDLVVGAVVAMVVLYVVVILATCQFAALARLWPYDLHLSLNHFDLDAAEGGGWSALTDSILLAITVGLGGGAICFLGAYASLRAHPAARSIYSLLALAPSAVPGLALGVAFILAFDDPTNPLSFLYGTPFLLAAALLAHLYSAPHLACVNRLKAVDPAMDDAARTLRRGGAVFLWRVVAPLCAPEILQIVVYLAISAMTSVSAAVFLYPPDFKIASVAVLNMDDSGDEAAAAAMGMMIVYVNLIIQGIGVGLGGAARRAAGQTAAKGSSKLRTAKSVDAVAGAAA